MTDKKGELKPDDLDKVGGGYIYQNYLGDYEIMELMTDTLLRQGVFYAGCVL